MAIANYRLRVSGLNNGAWWQCVMHYQADLTTPIDDLTSAQSLVNGWRDEGPYDNWLICSPDELAVTWLDAKQVTPNPGDAWWYDFGENPDNGTAGVGSPLNTSPIIKLYTAATPAIQGRIFMPGVAEADLVENVYTGGYVTNINNLVSALRTFTSDGITWSQVVYSPTQDIYALTIAGGIGPIIGNQRRRRVPK